MKKYLLLTIILTLFGSVVAIEHEFWVNLGLSHVKAEGDFYRLHEGEPVKCRNVSTTRILFASQLRLFIYEDAFIGIGNRLNDKTIEFLHDGLVHVDDKMDMLTTLDIPIDISYRFFSALTVSGGYSLSIPIHYERLNDEFDYADIELVRPTMNLETAISLQYKGIFAEVRYVHEMYSPLKPDDYGSDIVHRQLLFTMGFRLLDSRKKE